MDIKCALCGFVFNDNAKNCAVCFISKNGGVVCCHNCGYQFVNDEPVRITINKIKDWFKKKMTIIT
ncbi:MAG: hypothetical protein ABIA63_14795 [bacterium]